MCLGMANGYRVPEKEKSDFVISDKDGKLVVNYNGPKNTSKICGVFTIIEDDVTESKIEIAKEIVLNEMFDVIKDVVKNHEEFFIIKDLSEEDDPLGTIEFKKGFSVGAKAILPTVIISDSEDFLASRKVTFIDSGQSDIGTINELKRKLTEKDAEIQKLINEIAYLKVGNPGYENREFILWGAVNTFGTDTQLDIAIEEMSELIKAIIKYRRYNTPVTLGAVCEEVADVLIMMEQLRIITNSESVDQYFFDKIQRLDSRIKEYESNHKETTSDRIMKTFIGGDGI